MKKLNREAMMATSEDYGAAKLVGINVVIQFN